MPAGNLLPSVRSSPISNVSRRRRKSQGLRSQRSEPSSRGFRRSILILDWPDGAISRPFRNSRRSALPRAPCSKTAMSCIAPSGSAVRLSSRTPMAGSSDATCARASMMPTEHYGGCETPRTHPYPAPTSRRSRPITPISSACCEDPASVEGSLPQAISVPHRTCLIMSASSQRLLITTSQGMKDLDLSW